MLEPITLVVESIQVNILHYQLPSNTGVGKLFSEGAALLCPNFERAGMCVRLLMHHVF